MGHHLRSVVIAALMLCAAGTLLIAACGSSTDPGRDDAHVVAITVDGFQRWYMWNAPSGAGAAPVIVMLHGAGGRAEGMRQQTGMLEAGTRGGFVVVFGEAAEALDTWSGGCSSCSEGDPRVIDDVRYFDAILTDLAKRTSIDPRQIYVAGFSAGGSLAYNIACRRPGIVRAIVTAGALLHRSQAAQCLGAGAVSALVIFGDRDTTQPMRGSSLQFSVDSSAIFWSGLAQCSASTGPAPQAFGATTALVLTHSDCDGGVRVEAHTVVGSGHTWPRGGYDATTEALRLFGGR